MEKKSTIINNFLFKFSKIPVKEKIFFVQQLSIMVKTGISLAIALRTLSKQTKNKKMKTVLINIKDGVEKGETLSKGLEKYKSDFGELFVNMIRGGEESGKLEEVLLQLFIQMKKDHAIVAKVKGAMIYPTIVIAGMIAVGIFSMIYVLPSLISVFEEINAELPLPTVILIKASKFSQNYGIYLGILAILGSITFTRLITLPQGKKIFHSFLLKLPVASGIIKKINLARFSRTLSSLLKTDIAIIQTFEITSNILGNQLYKDALMESKEKIKKGLRIEEALRPYENLFPPVVLQMIAVGEETGSLDEILEQSAEFYEEDVDQTMTNFPSLIEPILILILGLGVGGIAVAVIMPLYSLSQQI